MTSENKLAALSPKEFRELCRKGEWTTATDRYKEEGSPGPCRGYAVANVAIVPLDYAFEFLLFCSRNPYPCPVLDVTEPGNPEPKIMAPGADLRTDVPRYRVYKDGRLVDEPTDILSYWRDDLVGFLLGCSASFDWVLLSANVKFRLLGAYTTNIQCIPAGRFHGPMVVTCRLVKNGHDATRAVQISSRCLRLHGPPVHYGDPAEIGIKDLYHPDMFSFDYDVAPQKPDELAMYWACGNTPETVAMASKVPFMITHRPGHLFMTDHLTEELAVL